MLSLKKKLDSNLRFFLNNRCYKNYRVLIKCKSLLNNIAKKISSYKGTLLYSLDYSNIICAILSSSSIERLIEYPEVEFVTFDEYLFICGNSVSHNNNFSHLESNAFQLSGKGIGIGFIDTGVYPHKDLISKTNRIYEFHDLVNNYNYPYDDNGHGTCIVGIICGNGLSSNGRYSGIANCSNIYCYKAFDKLGKGFCSDILFSLESLIKSSKDKNIKILCLPFELLNFNTFIINAFDKTFKEAIKIGMLPIVPSGSNKDSYNSIRGIAILDSCITVSGVKNVFSSESYPYSSTGPYKNKQKPNISAACFEITSLNSNKTFIPEKEGIRLYPTKLKSAYKVYSGTSIACAYICGICSLLFEKNPELTFKDICSLFNLYTSNKEFSKNQVGSGLLDIQNLFNHL